MVDVIWTRRGALALALATVSSCGGASQGGSSAATASAPEERLSFDEPVAGPAQAAPDEMPVAPPFVIPGERMSWKVSTHGVHVARYDMVVGEPGDVSGRNVIVVRSSLRSEGAVALVKKIEEDIETWIDVATARPVYFRDRFVEGKSGGTVEVEIAPGGFPVQVTPDGAEPKLEHQKVPENRSVFDLASMLMVIRRWDPTEGEVATAVSIRTEMLWRTKFEASSFEGVSTPLGSFPAIRIDGVSERLDRDFELDDSVEPRHYTVWLTDDVNRLPVVIVANTAYGDVRMEMTSYEPGSGQPIAP